MANNIIEGKFTPRLVPTNPATRQAILIDPALHSAALRQAEQSGKRQAYVAGVQEFYLAIIQSPLGLMLTGDQEHGLRMVRDAMLSGVI